jgi:hypothetical protein
MSARADVWFSAYKQIDDSARLILEQISDRDHAIESIAIGCAE